MKKITLFVTVLLIATLFAITAPVAAATNMPVGGRINLYGWPDEFPASSPFYIMHGWVQSSEDGAIGIFDFQLEVDGVLRNEDFKMFSAESGDPDTLWRRWAYNFPDGMTGTHTFTGHWFAPCQYAVDSLGYPGTCATPNEKVETATRTLTVTFVP